MYTLLASGWIAVLVEKLIMWFRDSLLWFMDIIRAGAWVVVEKVLGTLLAYLPDVHIETVAYVKPYLALANAWFPVDLLIALCLIYFTLWGTVFVTRVVMGLIPTIF